MTEFVFSLGSDFGNREKAVRESIAWLSKILHDSVASEIYETPPVGHNGSNYINAVVHGRCEIRLQELERMCKRYELEHGRDEEARREKRVPIDVDIVMAGGEVLRPKDYGCNFFRLGYSQVLTLLGRDPSHIN